MDNSAIDSFTATTGLIGGIESPDTRIEVEFAMTVLSLEPGARLLDLPCGNGRHARLFAQRGLRVTAVDLDAPSLAFARRDCAHPNVEYVQLDARSVAEEGRTFDSVASLFSCIGYFDDERSDEAALRAMASVLRPGGRILLSIANGPVVAGVGSTHQVFERGHFRIDRIDSYDPRRCCLERQFVILDRHTGERTHLQHRRRLYSPDELSSLLDRCGITETGRASSYSGSPFAPDESPHFIYLGCRQR